ncbi:MAG: helix-turn-helix domain containing protein [Candidatus Wolfebacteria bacterium]|nr:helix-turn-helix domain containing protein [Candidatus Wolfebacteria bacterium]
MAKSQKHILAIELRKEGNSIKDISRLLKISKSSASIWCRDVLLTSQQVDNLHSKMVAGGYKGRLKGAQMQKAKRKLKIKNYQKLGIKTIKPVGSRDLLMLGLGLYLGEGNKGGNQFQFTNSNSDIVRLIILWLKDVFDIKKRDLILNMIINQQHKGREVKIKNHWTKVTGADISQFNKTIFIKSKSKKAYSNLENYFGTITIRVKKSSDLQYKILGLCYGVLN